MKTVMKILAAICLISILSACGNDIDGIDVDTSSNIIDKTEATTDTLILESDKTDVSDDESTNNFILPDGNYVFSIDDQRENKSSLVGKYVFDVKEEVFFEIKEDEAILHKAFGEYAIFAPNPESLVLIITEDEKGIDLVFNYKPEQANYSNVVCFYSDPSDKNVFLWDNEMDHTTYKMVKKKYAGSDNFKYLLEHTDENVISIKVPETGDKLIDQLIYDDLCEYLNSKCSKKFDLAYSEEGIELKDIYYSEYYIDLEHKITYNSDEIISIVFEGILNYKSAAHPMHLFFTLNVNRETGQRIYFRDRYSIDTELYNVFSKYAQKSIEDQASGWPENWGEFSEDLCTLDSFISGMNNENEFFSYYTNEGIGISYPAPFTLGNHMEVIIPYLEVKVTEQYIEDNKTEENTVVVKEKKLSSDCYFKVYTDEEYAEVPMVSVMKELGAEVKWSGALIIVAYGDKEITFDTNDQFYSYPLPPGTKNGVRKIIDDEMIFEDTSARRFLKFVFGVTLTVDYDNGSIVVS